jgi:hypothetical protein
MSYQPKPLTYYERSFVVGSSFLSGGAFALCGHKLLSGGFPTYVYIFYLSTLVICLQLILRYFIIARVFQTESNLWAWSVSMMIALVGPITVYEALIGPSWFLCVVLLVVLGSIKTLQSKRAIRNNGSLPESQRELLSRIQGGVYLYQWYVAALMLGFWVATSRFPGENVAAKWFGVSNLGAWKNGVATLGGVFCFLASAHLGLRMLAWHRDYLFLFSPTASNVLRMPSEVQSHGYNSSRRGENETTSESTRETAEEVYAEKR